MSIQKKSFQRPEKSSVVISALDDLVNPHPNIPTPSTQNPFAKAPAKKIVEKKRRGVEKKYTGDWTSKTFKILEDERVELAKFIENQKRNGNPYYSDRLAIHDALQLLFKNPDPENISNPDFKNPD